MGELFEIGIVSGVHGVRGELKVYPYTNDFENLSNQRYFIMDGRMLEVKGARIQGKFLVVSLDDINDRDSAEKLKGRSLFIPRENAAPLPDGQYYMKDLMGCSVFENGVLLGKVDEIIETGSNDVYSVVNENGDEILIPAIKSVILDIDIAGKKIEVRLPEGLVDGEYI